MRDQSGCSEPIAASTEHDGGEPNTVRHQLRPLATVALVLQRWNAHEVELSVKVEEYLPRLAARFRAPNWTGALYAKGQRALHAAVSRRYFELLASRVGV